MLPTKFQRRKLKCEKIMDEGCQKLTLPLAGELKMVDKTLHR
jgi:hypothetical protein